jgi:hypothetical protein
MPRVGGVLGGADHRGAGADGADVDQGAAVALVGVDEAGDDHAQQDTDPGVLLHPGGAVGLGGGGGGGEDDPADGGADQGLDGVVDVVDHGELSRTSSAASRTETHGQGPAALDPAVGLGQGDDVGEAGQDADQQQRD